VLVTGGSSGIGRALALHYAAPGRIIGLLGRDDVRVREVADLCTGRGAAVEHAAIDVRDRDAMRGWILSFDRRHAVDLVFANAGLLGGARAGEMLEDGEFAALLMDTNVQGVMNTVQPLLAPLVGRRRGQIVLMGSLAGFVALPDSPSYCASKAAIMSWGLALREALRGASVKVNVVCPGFVTTPMTEQISGWKPGEVSAEDAVRRIVRGINRNNAIIAFPFTMAWLSRVGGVVPDWLRQLGSRPFRYKVKDER
jgi:NAD(P)-dependent dehydrogenase (short-subunit alcohol dehydrogenase family)